MTPKAMSDAERRSLLQDLRRLSTDADQHEDPLKVFLPLPIHGLALRPETLVVRGERGAGKTALFHCLSQLGGRSGGFLRLFPNARLPDSIWREGFSEKTSEHPSPHALDRYALQERDDNTLRLFWTSHLVLTLAESLPLAPASPLPTALSETWRAARNEPGRWVTQAAEHLGPLTQWLDDLDRRLAVEQKTLFVTYDHLDKLGLFSPGLRERYASALLALWLSLSNRYRCLRPKIFLREDLFEACQRAFPDASKLKPRSVSLDWSVESLYRLLIRHMAELGDGMRTWIQRGGRGIALHEDPLLGWMPPEALPEEGRISQKAFVDHLAGEKMGSGVQKGYTYRWIPNHLQDAHVRVVPRSLITLIRTAAEEALKHSPRAGFDRLIDPTELSAALEETSRDRVKELQEEHKVIARLSHLHNQVLLIERKVALKLLAKPTKEDDGFGSNGEAVLDEVLRIGVVSIRLNDRLDVPDIYRYAFGIKRKGGVARPD